jgi:DNA-binding transcriptional LysR family regulator
MTLDWMLVQSFVAVAEHGSLAAGARKHGGSQPTMSRHIAALEQALSVRLFDRTGGGLVLTQTGVALYADARAMAAAAGRLQLSAAGQSAAIAGAIRITASEAMSAWVLPDILTRLRSVEPEIAIELVASDQTDNLLQREADIAVRMFRPEQTELITRAIGQITLGMFATPEYLARAGTPTCPQDLLAHAVIGDDRATQILDGFRAAGMAITRDFFAFRSDSRVTQWQMVLAGFGIGFNQSQIGAHDPRVVRVLRDTPLPRLPIWLTTHAELRTSRRVRRVYDFLAVELEAFVKATN